MPQISIHVPIAAWFPSEDELACRAELVRVLSTIGEVIGKGAGGGGMDIAIYVENGPAGLRAATAAVEAIAPQATLALHPPVVLVAFPNAAVDWDVIDELIRRVNRTELGEWRGTSLTEASGYDVTFHAPDPVAATRVIEGILEDLGAANTVTVSLRD